MIKEGDRLFQVTNATSMVLTMAAIGLQLKPKQKKRKKQLECE